MPAISLGLDEVEERLQQIRRRFNSLSLQHVAYSCGSLIVTLGALLIFVRSRATPTVVSALMMTYALVVFIIILLAILRLRSRWLSLETVARQADRKAALDCRLATLHAQRLRPQRSRLGGILLTQTLSLGPRWDRSALAPHRISRSVYLLLASLVLLGTTALLPPGEVNPAVPDETSAADPPTNEPSVSAISPRETGESNVPGMLASAGHNEMSGPAGPSHGQQGQASGAAGPPKAGPSSPHGGTAAEAAAGGPASAATDARSDSQDVNRKRNESDSALRTAKLQRPGQGADEPDEQASKQKVSGFQQRAPSQEGTERDGREERADGAPRSNAHEESRPLSQAATKGGAKPSGKMGTAMDDPLFAAGEQPSTQPSTSAEPRRFALRLTGVSNSEPTTLEPQHQPGSGVFGLNQAAQQPSIADHQVEDEPLQKNVISPEHESLVQRIFRHE